MKALTVEKAQEIRAGKGHYHWICRDWANFTSKAYSSYANSMFSITTKWAISFFLMPRSIYVPNSLLLFSNINFVV